MDIFRLREIAEFGLGNALITLLVVPLSTTTGDPQTAVRVCGALGVAFVVGGGLLLVRRHQRLKVPQDRSWYVLPAVLDVAGIAAGVVTVVTGAIGSFEWQLLVLLSRPIEPTMRMGRPESMTSPSRSGARKP